MFESGPTVKDWASSEEGAKTSHLLLSEDPGVQSSVVCTALGRNNPR